MTPKEIAKKLTDLQLPLTEKEWQALLDLLKEIKDAEGKRLQRDNRFWSSLSKITLRSRREG